MTFSAKELNTKRRIEKALEAADTTKSVIIGSGAIASVTNNLTAPFDGKPVLIIADTNTFAAAGANVLARLKSSGRTALEPFIFDSNGLYAEIEYVEKLQHYLSGKDVVPVAVGSGTINDITKLAAERNGLPYMVVATAGSMDGYTAFGASISYKGAKQTFNCKAPLSVIADIDVIAAAPKKMNASGYADLIAKIPSGADWIVADALGIEPIDQVAWGLTQTSLRELVAHPSGIPSGNPDSILGLMEGLIMTGLGMQVSKTSRPASGAEHQFSHLWDNQHHTFNGSAPSHGFKVGIGSLASEALYEKILAKKTDDFIDDFKIISARWPQFEAIGQKIRTYFPSDELAEQMIEQSKAKYVDAEKIAERIGLLKSIWPELKGKIKNQLLGAEKLRQNLIEAGAPAKPEEIGISRDRLKLSYTQAQLIRKRYTVLDLVSESGLWESCVEPLFEKGGFWAE